MSQGDLPHIVLSLCPWLRHRTFFQGSSILYLYPESNAKEGNAGPDQLAFYAPHLSPGEARSAWRSEASSPMLGPNLRFEKHSHRTSEKIKLGAILRHLVILILSSLTTLPVRSLGLAITAGSSPMAFIFSWPSLV